MSTLTKQLARAYFTHFPIEKGKWRVWTKVLPHLAPDDDGEVDVRLKYGLHARLDLNEYIQRFTYYWGSWGPDETWVVQQLLRPGDTFIDAGANFGYFTMLASRIVGGSGQVFAFEPSPPTVRWLKRNLELNRATNVSLHEAAVADAPGTVRISKRSDMNSGVNTILTVEHPLDGWDIPSVQLDDVIPETRRVRILKVDVEGAELMLVKGFHKHIEAGLVSHVLVEVHDDYLGLLGSSAQEFFEVMASYGYRGFDFSRRRFTPLSDLRPKTAAERDQMNVLFTREKV